MLRFPGNLMIGGVLVVAIAAFATVSTIDHAARSKALAARVDEVSAQIADAESAALEAPSKWDAFERLRKVMEAIPSTSVCTGIDDCADVPGAAVANQHMGDYVLASANAGDERALRAIYGRGSGAALIDRNLGQHTAVLRTEAFPALVTALRNATGAAADLWIYEVASAQYMERARQNHLQAETDRAMDSAVVAWGLGSASASQFLAREHAYRNHPREAYLWSIRCGTPCSNVVDPQQYSEQERRELEALAGDPAVVDSE